MIEDARICLKSQDIQAGSKHERNYVSKRLIPLNETGRATDPRASPPGRRPERRSAQRATPSVAGILAGEIGPQQSHTAPPVGSAIPVPSLSPRQHSTPKSSSACNIAAPSGKMGPKERSSQDWGGRRSTDSPPRYTDGQRACLSGHGKRNTGYGKEEIIIGDTDC
jgi:hypothetical protein